MIDKKYIYEHFAKLIMRRKYVSFPDFCNQFYLPASETELSGYYNFDNAPYLLEIAERLSIRSKTREIALMCGSQMGKTLLMLLFMSYRIKYGSGNILYIMPNLDAVGKFSRIRLSTVLADCVDIEDGILETGSRKRHNTMLAKTFAGGTLTLTGSNSPIGLKSLPAPIIFFDEVDSFADSAGNEGDPISLANQRCINFMNSRVVFYTSTPTVKNNSNIEKQYMMGSRKLYYVECPFCNETLELNFENLKYKVNKNTNSSYDVQYMCQHCNNLFDERHKKDMVKKGKWLSQLGLDMVNVRESYRISGLYSLFLSWSDLVNDKLDSEHDMMKMQVFLNSKLCKLVDEHLSSPLLSDVAKELVIEHYSSELPDGILLLTAGVDVQDDRLAYNIVGWGDGEKCWHLEYDEFYCDLTQTKSWLELEKRLSKTYSTITNHKLKVASVGVNTAGHFANYASSFVSVRENRRYYSVIGSPTTFAGLVKAGKRSAKYKVINYSVNTVKIKDILFGRLSQNSEKTRIHFPHTFNKNYYDMLMSEKKVVVKKYGVKKEKYVKTRARNEALDCFVYNYAVLQILNPNYAILKNKIYGEKKIDKPKNQSTFVNTTKNWVTGK